MINKKVVAEIEDILVGGLCTDGAHHKQEALEEALMLLVSPEAFDMLKTEYEWED